ncbi:MAG: chemotaxis protein CheR [Spirochaetes bacterium]|nr:chemotaxis protein CheR [Spirochaetota bacterium]
MTAGPVDDDRILKPTILSEAEFRRLAAYIETELGIRMPSVKKIMLESRLQKRLKLLGFKNYSDYMEFIFSGSEGREELVNMIDAVTTNKTDFFREPDHFDFLAGTILPELTESGVTQRRTVQIWSAGCSTGEEPYTIAMIVADYCDRAVSVPYRIIASDLSTKVLDSGRAAIYGEEKVTMVSDSFKKRFMLKGKDRLAGFVKMKPELRNRIDFVRINFMDATYPVPRDIDVVFCRNVIIYFDRKIQEAMLGKICGYLRSGGYLVLGHSETLTGMQLPLANVVPTIYRRL